MAAPSNVLGGVKLGSCRPRAARQMFQQVQAGLNAFRPGAFESLHSVPQHFEALGLARVPPRGSIDEQSGLRQRPLVAGALTALECAKNTSGNTGHPGPPAASEL